MKGPGKERTNTSDGKAGRCLNTVGTKTERAAPQMCFSPECGLASLKLVHTYTKIEPTRNILHIMRTRFLTAREGSYKSGKRES